MKIYFYFHEMMFAIDECLILTFTSGFYLLFSTCKIKTRLSYEGGIRVFANDC